MKKYILFLFLAILLFSCNNKNESYKIAMVVPVSAEAFKQIENGIKEVCDSSYSIRVFSAEGQSSKFNTTIDAALITKPDFFVAIGSQIVTSALSEKYINKLPPIVAGSISIPSAVDALEKIGINPPRKIPINIVSQVPANSYSKLIDAIFDLKPSIKKIGIIFNESEINSKNMKNILSDFIVKQKAEVLLGAVTSPEDVYNISNKLIREGAEVIIIPHDKSATAKAATIAKLCNDHNLISCSLDDGIIKDGVTFAVSVKYEEVGKKIGLIIKDVKENHTDLKEMPMISFEDKDVHIYINKKIFVEKDYQLSEKFVGQIIEL